MIVRDLDQSDLSQVTSFYKTMLDADTEGFIDEFSGRDFDQFFLGDHYSVGAFDGTTMMGILVATQFDKKNLPLFPSPPSCLDAEQDYIHGRTIVVDPQRRHKNTGHLMCAALCKKALSSGKGIVVEVVATNHAAQRLYYSYGAKPLQENNGHILVVKPPLTST